MGRSEAVRQLTRARDAFCGIGTRKAKLRLNKLALRSPIARAYRLALEIEDASTLGKKYGGEWSYYHYEKKHLHIHELIILCQEQGWIYGKHKSDAFGVQWIVYFELPGCEQISFHANLDCECPDYAGQWDGKQHSTLNKLEAAITELLKGNDHGKQMEITTPAEAARDTRRVSSESSVV